MATKAMKLAGVVLGLLLWGVAQAGTRHYYYTDPQGTPLAKADAQGNIVERYEYTPYGVPVPSMGASPDGPGYTGHVNDPEAGLVYMQARYYDPVVGRFLSVDPVGPGPSNLFGFNRYAYAGNNPIMNIDPDGMEDCVSSGQSDQNSPPCPSPSPSKKPDPSRPTPLPAMIVIATAIGDVTGVGTVGGVLTTSSSIPKWVVRTPNPWTVFVFGMIYPGNMASCQEISCMPTLVYSFPSGYLPGDLGAAEWGRKHGVGAKEGKNRFHRGVKEHTPGARGDHDFGVNPETGDVVDQNGEPVGNLNDEH